MYIIPIHLQAHEQAHEKVSRLVVDLPFAVSWIETPEGNKQAP